MRLVLISVLLLALAAAVAALVPALADDPVTIAIRDHQFVPSEVAIPAGVQVQLLVRNEQNVTAEFESTSLHREKVVPPGGQTTVFVGPLSPGSYEFFDDFHGETRGHLVAK